MEINITFFIQAFHFFVAYCILEKLFFRPTVTTIEDEKKIYNDLLDTINSQQIVLQEKENLKKEKWNIIKKRFAQTIPQIQTKDEKMQLPRIKPKSALISNQERQEYQQKLQNELIQRLKYVS